MDAATYRKQAEEAQRNAAKAVDPHVKALWLSVAEKWEAAANAADLETKPGRW